MNLYLAIFVLNICVFLHFGMYCTQIKLTLFMWICCWYCFCFSRNCWCCCWMTSWAKVLWGRGADWVLFSGLCRGNLCPALRPDETFSLVANGDCGWRGPVPAGQQHTSHQKKSQWNVRLSFFIKLN